MLKGGIQPKNSQRVLRGGSWINEAQNLRSANRNANEPDNRNHNIGVRLAGALFDRFFYRHSSYDRGVIKQGGSINQLYFPFVYYSDINDKQNQGSRCVSKLLAKSLPLSRIIILAGGIGCK